MAARSGKVVRRTLGAAALAVAALGVGAWPVAASMFDQEVLRAEQDWTLATLPASDTVAPPPEPAPAETIAVIAVAGIGAVLAWRRFDRGAR